MKILLDTDALFALYYAGDALHLKASKKLHKLDDNESEYYMTNLVLQELATVISDRLSQAKAVENLKKLKRMEVKEVFINQEITFKIWEIFKKQTKKGTSFIDCSNVVACQEFGFDKIFSFDKFYKSFGLLV